MPLALRTGVIDQTVAIAMHPAYDCNTAIVSVAMIQCLTQSPEAHAYIARREAVENMLQMCELKQKMVCQQLLPLQVEKKDTMMINALKYVTMPPQIFCTSYIWSPLSYTSLSFFLSLSLSLTVCLPQTIPPV